MRQISPVHSAITHPNLIHLFLQWLESSHESQFPSINSKPNSFEQMLAWDLCQSSNAICTEAEFPREHTRFWQLITWLCRFEAYKGISHTNRGWRMAMVSQNGAHCAMKSIHNFHTWSLRETCSLTEWPFCPFRHLMANSGQIAVSNATSHSKQLQVPLT